jgi:hypothetical protein
MLCIGLRTEGSIEVGFPYVSDDVLSKAVIERLQRIRLGSNKGTTTKDKPFTHTYKVKNRVVLLCAHNKEAIPTDKVKQAFKVILLLAKKGNTITMSTLADVVQTYTPKYDAMPSTRLMAAAEVSRMKLDRIKEEMAETEEIMKQGIGMTLDRQERLDDLEAQSVQIREESHLFSSGARHVERKARCELCRARCCLISVAVVVFLCLAGGGIFAFVRFVLPVLTR